MDYTIPENTLQQSIADFLEKNDESSVGFSKLMRSDSQQSLFYQTLTENSNLNWDLRQKGYKKC